MNPDLIFRKTLICIYDICIIVGPVRTHIDVSTSQHGNYGETKQEDQRDSTTADLQGKIN